MTIINRGYISCGMVGVSGDSTNPPRPNLPVVPGTFEDVTGAVPVAPGNSPNATMRYILRYDNISNTDYATIAAHSGVLMLITTRVDFTDEFTQTVLSTDQDDTLSVSERNVVRNYIKDAFQLPANPTQEQQDEKTAFDNSVNSAINSGMTKLAVKDAAIPLFQSIPVWARGG